MKAEFMSWKITLKSLSGGEEGGLSSSKSLRHCPELPMPISKLCKRTSQPPPLDADVHRKSVEDYLFPIVKYYTFDLTLIIRCFRKVHTRWETVQVQAILQVLNTSFIRMKYLRTNEYSYNALWYSDMISFYPQTLRPNVPRKAALIWGGSEISGKKPSESFAGCTRWEEMERRARASRRNTRPVSSSLAPLLWWVLNWVCVCEDRSQRSYVSNR